jgi:DNA-binding MarR family transcriptional regulator
MFQTLVSLPTWTLSAAATRSHQILQQMLSEAGVSGYEYRCLVALAAVHAMSQADLGDAAVLDPRDITHTVRALEGRGLLLREKDPDHGRKILVSLTLEGQQTAARLAGIMAEIQARVFGQLSTEELSILLGLLKRVGEAAHHLPASG